MELPDWTWLLERRPTSLLGALFMISSLVLKSVTLATAPFVGPDELSVLELFLDLFACKLNSSRALPAELILWIKCSNESMDSEKSEYWKLKSVVMPRKHHSPDKSKEWLEHWGQVCQGKFQLRNIWDPCWDDGVDWCLKRSMSHNWGKWKHVPGASSSLGSGCGWHHDRCSWLWTPEQAKSSWMLRKQHTVCHEQ